MPLTAGTRIGPHETGSPIDKGGTAEALEAGHEAGCHARELEAGANVKARKVAALGGLFFML
jgi:hypothetical protein